MLSLGFSLVNLERGFFNNRVSFWITQVIIIVQVKLLLVVVYSIDILLLLPCCCYDVFFRGILQNLQSSFLWEQLWMAAYKKNKRYRLHKRGKANYDIYGFLLLTFINAIVDKSWTNQLYPEILVSIAQFELHYLF